MPYSLPRFASVFLCIVIVVFFESLEDTFAKQILIGHRNLCTIKLSNTKK
jgi:hypothetical protein